METIQGIVNMLIFLPPVELLLGVLADAPNVKPSTVSIKSGVLMRVPLRRGVSMIIAQHGFI